MNDYKDCVIYGHKYEARYDSQPASGDFELDEATLEAFKAIAAYNTVKTYVQDICVRCGDVVKRDQGPPIAVVQS